MGHPLLSILIPAYEYPAGIARILGILEREPRFDVEIMISDDSTSDLVRDTVAPFLHAIPNLAYSRNTPGVGACANWNLMLERARGDYCLLLHHDEFPASGRFLEQALGELARAGHPDVLVLRCVLVKTSGGRNALHTPTWLRRYVIDHAPQYLFMRNVIGAPSVLIVKRSLYPRFDEHLKWLIDVDAYVRLFVRGTRVRFSDDVTIVSIPDRHGSITASMRSNVLSVRQDELRYLSLKYPGDPAVGLLTAAGFRAQLVRFIETAWWASFRCAQRVFGMLRQPLAASDLRRTLGAP